ncbi:MAG: hypothetical protein M5U22_20595 [Thermoleophilia bacterium]|nr:hypothetical protein [Thermoleophilia bacterium]
MSTERRRLERIEGALTPQQGVLLWMQEAHQFGDMISYGRWLVTQADEAYPLIRLPKQVVGAVREAMKGRPPEEVNAQALRAQRDVVFLVHLHKLVNERMMQDTEVLRLEVELLREKLRALLQHTALAQHVACHVLLVGGWELPKNSFSHLKPWQIYDLGKDRWSAKTCLPFDQVPLPARVREWVGERNRVLAEQQELETTARLLGARYFAGTLPLYPDLAERLALLAEVLEALGAAAEGLPGASGLSRAKKGERPGRRDQGLAAHLVDLAKAETWSALGDQDRACEIAVSLL